MHIQRDRLALADWLRDMMDGDSGDPAAKLGRGDRKQLLTLCEALDAVEAKVRSHPTVSDTLDRETLRQRAATEEVLVRLNEIRTEISGLERDSEEASELASHFDRTERFLGRLEHALRLYDRADQSSALRDEISGVRAEIGRLQAVISEGEIQRRLRNALSRIEASANQFVPQLDAEWPDAPVRLIINDLTIKVVRGSRDDYLWEIGSGANWLAYHVAMTLALQKFFLTEPHHYVPGFLIYDQPSQVYFPKRAAGDDESDSAEVEWRDQDVEAVRKVFALLGTEARAANGRLQIIVLDHAGEDVWGALDSVGLTEEWRGRGLVPEEWYRR